MILRSIICCIVALAAAALRADDIGGAASPAEGTPIDAGALDAEADVTEWGEEVSSEAVARDDFGPPPDSLVVPPSSAQQMGMSADVVMARPDYSWYGGLDLTILNLRLSNSQFSVYPDGAWVGPRGFFGVEGADGWGGRMRYWGINGTEYAQRDSPYSDEVFNDEVSLAARRFDWDAYYHWRGNTGDISLGASFTYASLKINEALSSEFQGFADAALSSSNRNFWLSQQQGEYIGVGPTKQTAGGVGFFVDGRQVVRRTEVSQWAYFGSARTALLDGVWKDATRHGRMSGDAVMLLHEGAIGVEYQRRMRSATGWFRLGAECQIWDTTIVDDLALAGITVSGGLAW